MIGRGSTVAATYWAVTSLFSTGRTCTLTGFTSAVLTSGAICSAAGCCLAVDALVCGPPSQPLSQSTAGTTTIRPATRPRTAAPTCWRYQRSSLLTVGCRQVDGIGMGSSS